MGSLQKAYADDLAFLTRTPKGNQLAIDATDSWLEWTETMKAKPKKCVCVGFKRLGTRYSCFDPHLSIAGEPFRYIIDTAVEDPLKSSHFKFLGRWMAASRKETCIYKFIEKNLFEYLNIVDGSLVNGFMKLWMYQHFILSKLAWPLMIYDLNISFMKRLQSKVNVILKEMGWHFC